MQKKMLDLSKINIMVVDDNVNMRNILVYILRVLGVEKVETATDPADAFAALKTFRADIIITDWMMEPLDGLDFVRLLRTASDSPNPTVPVIMVSGHTEMARISEARDVGVTEFVAKPISPKALYMRICEVILRPRQFVKTNTFFGPDRQRHSGDSYSGELRRKRDNIEPETDGQREDESEDQFEFYPGRRIKF